MASEMRKYKKLGRVEAKEYLRAKKEARLEGQEAYDEFAASVKQQKKDFKARMEADSIASRQHRTDWSEPLEYKDFTTGKSNITGSIMLAPDKPEELPPFFRRVNSV